jgi:hypothetical protein
MSAKAFRQWLWLLSVFSLVVSCGFQRQHVTPSTGFTITPASTAVNRPTVDSNPVPTSSPSATMTLQYVAQNLLSTLPPGQYVFYTEGDDCWESNPDLSCDLSAVSMDGIEYHSLVQSLPSDDFIYQNGYLAFTTYYPFENMNNQIQVLNLETNQFTEMPIPRLDNCKAEDWLPDGTSLVVLCSHGDKVNYYEINLLSVPGGELTHLIDDPDEQGASGGYEQPRLSPDGRWLAFYHIMSRGPYLTEGLYVLDMACASVPSTCQNIVRRLPVERLVGEFGNRVIDWTPDGYLAIAIDNQIDLYDVSTWQRIRTLSVSEDNGYITKIVWSPDGEWVLVLKSYAAITTLVPTSGGQDVQWPIWANTPFWVTVP